MTNVVVGVGWIAGPPSAGVLLGRAPPGAVKPLGLITVAVVFLSILPGRVSPATHRLAARAAGLDPIIRLEPREE